MQKTPQMTVRACFDLDMDYIGRYAVWPLVSATIAMRHKRLDWGVQFAPVAIFQSAFVARKITVLAVFGLWQLILRWRRCYRGEYALENV